MFGVDFDEVNIPSTVVDANYRYKMPLLKLTMERLILVFTKLRMISLF